MTLFLLLRYFPLIFGTPFRHRRLAPASRWRLEAPLHVGRFNIIKRLFTMTRIFGAQLRNYRTIYRPSLCEGSSPGTNTPPPPPPPPPILHYSLLGTLYLHKFIHLIYIGGKGNKYSERSRDSTAYGVSGVVGTIELSDGRAPRRLASHHHLPCSTGATREDGRLSYGTR